jgi:hypothetical protein
MDIYSISISENGEHLGKLSVSKTVKLRRKNNVCPIVTTSVVLFQITLITEGCLQNLLIK